MDSSSIDLYRRQIEKALQAGNATEHTHRPALKTLIEALATGVTATNEPKRVECGAPDFVVSRKARHGPVTLGYIEAKDVGRLLDEIERSDQMKRYLPALPNLILTDYLEFRWYIGGSHRQSARIARVSKGGKLVPEKDGAKAVSDLLTEFLSQKAEPINDPKTLALRMAKLTHFIRDINVAAFEKKSASATLRDLHRAFEEALIPDLPIPQFADMFAQTLAYGLFAARCNHRGPTGSFKRLGAASEIPKTNPFLRQLFETITGTALDDEPFVGFVDDLAQLLADTDIEAVLADFGKRTARQDPVVHFYETFLAAYDPKLRESRGVYYTPEPVVSYIVRSVDHLLKTRFGCPSGLADTSTVEYEQSSAAVPAAHGASGDAGATQVKATSPRVLILDPACGTGTFLYSVIDQIRNEFTRQGNAGMWSGYVRNHLLPRIFGFELLMAPYAVAHFKLGMQLAAQDLHEGLRKKWAYDFAGDERLGVFLTNTLEQAIQKSELLLGKFISDEANAAADIKGNLPILVVMGNPPYSGISANRSQITELVQRFRFDGGTRKPLLRNGRPVYSKKVRRTFIGQLIEDYKRVDGQPLAERKQWLQDDYVKFIRFAQWRIERTGHGILGFITNHGYLDNPTFRGMRQSLLDTFGEIFVYDLHGSSKKKQASPDGGKDENVFDIQQGVSILLCVKLPGSTRQAQVYHGDLWGVRESKYKTLDETEVASTKWKKLTPTTPMYFFTPQYSEFSTEYQQGLALSEIFPLSGVGCVTARDSLTIGLSQDEMWEKVKTFASLTPEAARATFSLGDDARDWKVQTAQQDVRSSGPEKRLISRILNRPFDLRYTYYTGHARGFYASPCSAIMQHMLETGNIGLVCSRFVEIGRGFEHVFCTNSLVQHHSVTLKEVNYLFPLYICSSRDTRGTASMFQGRRPNLKAEFITETEKRLRLRFVPDGRGDKRKTFGPEDIFNYIYAIFHSPTYRIRYAEFLKSDFPRVPLTSDVNLFRFICGLGAQLVALHLLESPTLTKPIARYPVNGSNLVEKGFPKFLSPGEPEPGTGTPLKAGRVYINSSKPQTLTDGQYFEGVPPEVWNFHIGGYQVCEKWLKDRRGRTLSYDDLEHYGKIVTALQETIRLMAEIDAAIPNWPIQ